MIHTVIILILCHLAGDYVLQTPFIAETKGKNLYHMFIHCALYCLPFLLVYGFTWQLGVLFASHMIIDPLKAQYGKINYTTDQVLHYIVALVYLI